MDQEKLTLKTQEILQKAQQIASENGNQSIEMGHTLEAILSVDKDVTPFLFKELNVNTEAVKLATKRIIESSKSNWGTDLPFISNESSYA